MQLTLESLLSRRLLIVTGKGGTGKTTVVAALGTLAARFGVNTVVVEVGDDAVLPHLLGKGRSRKADATRDPVQVAPHLFRMHLRPRVALTEFLELQLRVKAIARGIVGNASFQKFLDAAPGWRELITLGKLWHLSSLEDSGKPRWPLVIVDAPATGHGISFLSIPNVIVDTVRIGPLRRHTEAVQDLLKDPERTLVLPVTLPEELPINETLELCARLRELGFGIGPIVANGIEARPDIPDLDAVLRAIGKLPSTGAPPLAEPRALADALQHRLRRAILHREFLGRLEGKIPDGFVRLPQLVEDLSTVSGIGELSTRLEAAL